MSSAAAAAGTEPRLTTGVIICAYTLDRFADIERAVQSLADQQPAPPDQVVLVIDHNHDLEQRARERWPELDIIASTGPKGLSGARNSGIAHCRTDLVLFLDDDASARPDWLAELCAPFADPAVAVTGGYAQPAWPGGRAPVTLPPELLWVVGCTYQGQPTQTADVRNVMGCSMAFRATALARAGGFVDGVGRTAELPLGCEETEICIRIRQQDRTARVVFVPASIVDHRVSADRLTWTYLRRRSYAEGISKVAVGRLVGAQDAMSTERAYASRVLPKGVLRELLHGRVLSAIAIPVSLLSFGVGALRSLIARRSG